MPIATKIATQNQIGKEGARGTAVAATRKLIGNMTFKELQAQEHFDGLDYGLLARTAQTPETTRNGVEAVFTFPLDFEQILMALLSGVKGGVTGVGGAADKTWTFEPAVNADPNIDTYTLESVISSFTDEAELETPYAFCTGFTVRGGVEGLSEVTMNLVGRKAVASTKTGALAIPTLHRAANLRWAITSDVDFATMIGGAPTQVLAQVYGFTYEFRDFVFPQYYEDNRVDLDFSTYHFRKRTVDLTFDVAHNPAATGLVEVERTAKKASSTRYIGLNLTGAALGGSNYALKLRGAYTHMDDSLQERGRDRDGNMVTTWHLQSCYDSVAAKDISIIVVNGIAAFP